MPDVVVLALSGASVGLAGLCSIPAIYHTAHQLRVSPPKDHFYEDVDGTSTPESSAAFSNWWSKTCTLILAIAGFGTAVALSVLSTIDHADGRWTTSSWLLVAAWGTLVLQSVCMAAIHDPVKVHDLGAWALSAALATLVGAVVQLNFTSDSHTRALDESLILRWINLVLNILFMVSALSFPRRPDVYYKGAKVDRQYTVSFLERYNWTYMRPLLDLATKKGDLDDGDLLQPDHRVRAESLVQKWHKYGFKGKLIRSILWAYRVQFLLQVFLSLLQASLSVAPYWIMRQLLEALQSRQPGEAPDARLWVLVALFGLSTVTIDWLNGMMGLIGMTRIGTPLRAQLSALIFEKSLRRKNVKGAEKAEKAEKAEEAPGVLNADVAPPTVEAQALVPVDADTVPLTSEGPIPAEPHPAPQESPSTQTSQATPTTQNDGGESPQGADSDTKGFKTQQAVVNLIAVDTRRIAQFLSIAYYILASILKLVFFSVYLVVLIGWIPFFCGLAAWGLIVPLSSYAAKLYMKRSDKVMKIRDEKLAVVNEALLGMRQIKFAALEMQWQDRISLVRERELSMLWKLFVADILLNTCWIVSPIALAAISLATYAAINGHLSPPIAFVSIGVFKALEGALGSLPELLTLLFDQLVSINRIDQYLRGPEMPNVLSDGPEIKLDNASVAWPADSDTPDDQRYILRNVDLKFPNGELSVISGKTGSGKSLLLAAIIGEADLLSGVISVPPTVTADERHDDRANAGDWIIPGNTAYVGQTPWLEGDSLRNNILFGLPLVQSRYDQVLNVCALEKDVEILPDGDRTELGPNGINLSGGQKWRITLARAVYSRAEILVMDDIFSAVDAHVGRHIFEKCICGDICKDRTRILVTHHVSLVLPETKYIVEVGQGTIQQAGLVTDVDGSILARIQSREESDEQEVVPEGENGGDTPAQVAAAADGKKGDAKKFVEEEKREKGMVKSKVYSTYLADSGGFGHWSSYMLLFVAFEAASLGRAWWLRIWTGQDEQQASLTAATPHMYQTSLLGSSNWLQHQLPVPQATFQTSEESSLSFYLWVYVSISVLSAVIGTVRGVWTCVISIKASRRLFDKILGTVLRTPLRWVDTVPVGRILNRFTADFDTIDQRISMDMAGFTWHLLGMVSVCVAGFLVSVYAIPPALILVGIAFVVAKKYMDGARPMRRLESNSKSPVLELFNASLAGLTTLRAFKKSGAYVDRMRGLLDHYSNISVNIWWFNRWMGWRMSIIGASFTTIIAIIVVSTAGIDAALAGFALSFASDFSFNLIFGIRVYSSLELDMNATERVIEYTLLETEDQSGEKPPASWPTSGRMDVRDLTVSYATDLPPVLKGVSFDVKDKERVGIVGRTGAGKSSLTLALFRFLERQSGTVTIDGLDVSKMDLHSLRSRLAIIPQDPMLFSGTIRENLDPFSNYTDQELHECLARVHLTEASDDSAAEQTEGGAGNANIFLDLSSPVSESGGNLSQGQRQLLCLARAIVSRPKIMLLDEATSAVDMSTDVLIQRSIRQEFNDSTLLVIAHRLSTIADFDRILVLSEGKVAEFGTPRELWNAEGSIFRDMCEKSGETEKLQETIFGSQSASD